MSSNRSSIDWQPCIPFFSRYLAADGIELGDSVNSIRLPNDKWCAIISFSFMHAWPSTVWTVGHGRLLNIPNCPVKQERSASAFVLGMRTWGFALSNSPGDLSAMPFITLYCNSFTVSVFTDSNFVTSNMNSVSPSEMTSLVWLKCKRYRDLQQIPLMPPNSSSLFSSISYSCWKYVFDMTFP